jgi:hypothetical protein
MQTRRRHFAYLAAMAAYPLGSGALSAQPAGDDQVFTYRGFSADVSAIAGASERAAILASLQHQLDIAADSGAKPAIIAFFQSQKITLKPGAGDAGKFNSNQPGVTVNAAVQPPQKPIVLHELLHAFHFRVLPGGFDNPDIVRFYEAAVMGRLYKSGAYVTKDVQEYFAVTASLYLWGHVDRPPFTRDNLKARQPDYYAWLGQLFGVEK